MWDLTANACSCELVPEVGTAVRSLTVALDGSMIVAANNHGTCYVWRMMRGTSLTTHFEPLHKLRAHQASDISCLNTLTHFKHKFMHSQFTPDLGMLPTSHW